MTTSSIDVQAWRFLLSTDRISFPVDPSLIPFRLFQISYGTYDAWNDFIIGNNLQSLCSKPAFSYYSMHSFVFYDASLPQSAARFAVAHEFGHVLLHLESKNNGFSPRQEAEADEFARAFLAPIPVLRAMGIKTAADIARVTGLPIEQAAIVSAKLAASKPDKSVWARRIIEQFGADKIVRKRRRKRLLLVLYVFLFLCCIAWGIKSAQPTKVYITRSGTRYHNANCPTIVNSYLMSVPINEAEGIGLTPCDICMEQQ